MIDLKNLIKYLVMFLVTSMATMIIPTCGVLKQHAIYVGLISASTFALIDICSPQIIVEKENNI
jgi:exosortase/archaeosortase|tara:strand:- start:234 stop:425 length:192 start_codon:yes stop_codon:yes gene_type:complete